MSWLDTLENIRKKDFSQATHEEKEKAARDVVNMASYACAVVAVSPVPFSDAMLMLPFQTAMVMTVGHVYGRKMTQADTKELILELGTTAGMSLLARQGIKALLPVVGALLTVPAAYAANWAIGRVAMEYFRNPDAPKDQLKKVYESAREEGSKLFSRERFDAFRKSVMGKQSTPPPAAEPSPPEAEEEDEPADEEAAEEPKKRTAKPKAKAKKKPTTKKKAKALSTADIVEGDFVARLDANPEARKAFDGVIHLDIGGEDPGQWTIDTRKEDDWVRAGLLGKAKLTVKCTSQTLGALMAGQTSAQLAAMSGDLTFVPMDLDLALKLGPLFTS